MKVNNYAAKKRLILAGMIIVPFIPFCLAMGIGYFYFMTSLEQSTMAKVQRVVGDHGRMIDTFLDERRSDLAFVLRSHSLTELSRPAALNVVFERLHEKSGHDSAGAAQSHQ